MARDRPVAVIFRRGPSRWFQVIRWNTESDTFEDGQWMNGRVYPELCDISPDGTKLIYFVMAAHWSDASRTSWTAVSKVPFLHALFFWETGLLSGAGGFFVKDCFAVTPDGMLRLPSAECIEAERASETECLSLSNAWSAKTTASWISRHSKNWEWHLKKEIETGGANTQFSLCSADDRIVYPIPRATCAGWDQTGRLVYADGGKLVSGSYTNGHFQRNVIMDFDDGRCPTTTELPEWAKRW